MKIVFFLLGDLSKSGGVERVLTKVSNELSTHHEIKIMSLLTKKTFYELNSNIEHQKIYSGLKIKNIIKNLKILLSEKKDIIIFLGFKASFYGLFSFFNREKKIIWEHNSYFEKKGIFCEILKKNFLNFFDGLIILNKTDTVLYEKFIEKEKIFYIPNPTPFESEKKSDLSNEILISIGRFVPVKGFDDLIEIFSIVKNKNPLVKLKIIGRDISEKKKISEMIKEKKLEDSVFLKDETQDIELELIQSDIYLMTSKNECFPMVLLEAKELGVPIVTFDCNSGPRDIVKNNEDGYLIENRNIEMFAEKVNYLLKNKNVLKNFSENAKKNSREYSSKTIIKLWERMFLALDNKK